MPARKRHRPGGAAEQPDLSTRSGRRSAQEAAALTFAEREREARAARQAEARARREEADRLRRRQELVAAKDAAAARVKRLRQQGAPGAQRVEADAAYRAALDALLRDEQGLPPLDEDPTST